MNHDEQLSVGIVDYGVGNLFSVVEACRAANLDAQLITKPEELDRANGVILPGVGAFGTAVQTLNSLGLFSALQDYGRSDRPLLGICLGMQLLFDASEEFGTHRGLGLIPGTVKQLRDFSPPDPSLKVPHIGWTPVQYRFSGAEGQVESELTAVFEDIPDKTEYYFVHSFAAEPAEPTFSAAESEYLGRRFCSVAHSRNIIGMQFHPERSAAYGLKVYRNWANMLRNRQNKVTD